VKRELQTKLPLDATEEQRERGRVLRQWARDTDEMQEAEREQIETGRMVERWRQEREREEERERRTQALEKFMDEAKPRLKAQRSLAELGRQGRDRLTQIQQSDPLRVLSYEIARNNRDLHINVIIRKIAAAVAEKKIEGRHPKTYRRYVKAALGQK
jgi:hypothetical protein